MALKMAMRSNKAVSAGYVGSREVVWIDRWRKVENVCVCVCVCVCDMRGKIHGRQLRVTVLRSGMEKATID